MVEGRRHTRDTEGFGITLHRERRTRDERTGRREEGGMGSEVNACEEMLGCG
jgi:hypothetical protein